MRTVYTRNGVRMVRDLLTGEEWDLMRFTHLRLLAGEEIWAAPTPVGPTCDGVTRWAYRPDVQVWVKGTLSVCEDRGGLYWWQNFVKASPAWGYAPTLHAAKKAAERAAKGDR